jgi:hypothetical protein
MMRSRRAAMEEELKKEEAKEYHRKNLATILDEQATKIRFVGSAVGYKGFGGNDPTAIYYILSDVADILDKISEDLKEQNIAFPKRPI